MGPPCAGHSFRSAAIGFERPASHAGTRHAAIATNTIMSRASGLGVRGSTLDAGTGHLGIPRGSRKLERTPTACAVHTGGSRPARGRPAGTPCPWARCSVLRHRKPADDGLGVVGHADAVDAVG